MRVEEKENYNKSIDMVIVKHCLGRKLHIITVRTVI